MYKVNVFPYEDSPMHADACRVALDLPRDIARELGQSAVRIVAEGEYIAPSGGIVSIAEATELSRIATVNLPPWFDLTPPTDLEPVDSLTITVTNETSFVAAQRLIAGGKLPLILNFANGIEPGGGFLNGARAQEETLARSSGLYETIKDSGMYAHHRAMGNDSFMASPWAILSFGVPVFRTDAGALLETPWLCDFLTCAAPVASRVGLERANPAMQERIERVLAIARSYDYRSLVLGAWGCGAFHNDPHAVAAYFRDALMGDFLGEFDEVIFAIADWSPERRHLAPFRDIFANMSSSTKTDGQ